MATGKSGSFEIAGTKSVTAKILWSETYDVISNTSVVTITDVQVKNSSWYGYTYYLNGTLQINGETVVTFSSNLGSHSVRPGSLNTYTSIAANGSYDPAPWGAVTVDHNEDGTGTCPIVVYFRGWQLDEKASNGFTIDGSSNVSLTAIDRAAPTVSCSISNITANGFKISATSSATSDQWSYSLDDGVTGVDMSASAGTSASCTVTGLSPNTTYYVRVAVRKVSNHVYGESSSIAVKTLGGAAINSCPTITADAATVTFIPNVTVYDTSYSYYLSICNGSTEYLALGARTWAVGTAARTITLSQTERADLLEAMASIKSFTATIKVVTKSGTTQIGNTSSCTCTVQTTAANSGPSMTAFTYKDSRATTTAVTGNDQLFIQTYSYLYVTPGTAAAKNGASIVKYAATCNGKTYSNTTGAALNLYGIAKSGTVDVVVTATDSRGYTVSNTQQITVIPYVKPKVSAITLRRTNDIEAEMQLTFNGSISPVTVDGTQKNSLLYVQYRYKLTSESSYGSYTSILSSVAQSGTSFSFSNLELCSLDANSSYDFHIYIRDQLNTLSALSLYFTVPQGTPLVALRKKMVGINTPAPEAALHVVGDTIIEGGVTAATVDVTTVNATTLNGSLAPAKLSAAVPISKGGTGSTTAAAAATAIVGGQAITPKSVSTTGSQYWNSGAYGLHLNNSDIVGINGLWFPDAIDSAGEGINFYRSSTTWDRLYAYGGVLYFAPNIATATHPGTRYTVYHSGGATIPLSKGGTGATTAATARTNLGIAATSLYSGTLSSGSTTFNYGSYNFYVVVGRVTSSGSLLCSVIPKGMITTSDVTYQFADESYYRAFKLKYSGSTVTLTIGGGYGSVTNVYGIN